MTNFVKGLVGAALGVAAMAATALELSGPLVQGALVQGRVDPGARVAFNDRPLRVSDEGVFVFGLGRDAPAAGVIRVTHADGGTEERRLAIRQRDYEIQRIDGLPPRKVTPPAAALERIRAEARQAREARRRDAPRTDFLGGFQWPVEGIITGVYGSQRILNGEPRRPHYGIDIAAPTGTPVRAPAGGVVTLVHEDMFFSGGTLIVDHGHGVSSTFLHLERILVAEGERVRQGDVIAEVGATGRVTGAHLDWRMNHFSERLDPVLVAGPMPSSGGGKGPAPEQAEGER
ncbi:MAG: M23 family metallopeptidase [Gammaproteobacteria bacterium]|nr:M23 family metallopeptidase [Gammaproteobacteria bacterium]